MARLIPLPLKRTLLASRNAVARAIELHGAAAQGQMNRDAGGVYKSLGFSASNHFAVFCSQFIRMRGNHGGGFDEFIDDIRRFFGTGRKRIADIDHGQFSTVMAAYNGILLGGDAGIAGQIHCQTVREG